jgi:branched-chain amino acid transport system ATP-binding protein
MLDIEHLYGGWGPTLVVEDISLSLKEGETLSVIGRNGVGKSTLLELIVGRAQQRSGSIRVGGRELSGRAIHQRARMGLGFVPQSREVFTSLTVREHLMIAARPGQWTIPRVLEMFPRLGERADSFGTQLSGGEQQMLAIARALLGNPMVLLMDEPFEGLAPIIVEQLVQSIQRVVREGRMTALLVEQRVDIALSMSQRCMVMDRGRCMYQGSSAELAADTAGVTSLMGLAH